MHFSDYSLKIESQTRVNRIAFFSRGSGWDFVSVEHGGEHRPAYLLSCPLLPGSEVGQKGRPDGKWNKCIHPLMPQVPWQVGAQSLGLRLRQRPLCPFPPPGFVTWELATVQLLDGRWPWGKGLPATGVC